MLLDEAGNLYGTGVSRKGRKGVLFRLAPAGKFKALMKFDYYGERKFGSGPRGHLLRDPSGTIFGVAGFGARFNAGAVYQWNPDGTKYVLHDFRITDGANPRNGLVRDKAGNLYGVTSGGGEHGGGGTLFELEK